MIRIVLLDDHPVLRHGIRAVLDTQSDFEVIAEAGSVAEASAAADGVDVALVDLDLGDDVPDGIDAIRAIRQVNPAARVLVFTAYDSDADIVRALDADAAALALRAGAGIEIRNDLEQTPLLLASANDRVEVARLLVALGADPDAVDHQHDTPWLVTGVTGGVAMLEALLPAKPDMSIPNRYGGLSPIPVGERGHADYMARVVTTGVDIDHVNNLGWTALLEAVLFGDGSQRYVDLVTSLVDAGADVSIPDGSGVTALEHARMKGQNGVAAVLENASTP